MRTWAISNQKGGVGKTTTTVALGSLLAVAGKRTLLIDMDPHASLSGYIGVEGGAHGSVYDLFGVGSSPTPVRTLVHATQWNNLSVLPASAAMITLDRQLGTRAGMGLILSCLPAAGILIWGLGTWQFPQGIAGADYQLNIIVGAISLVVVAILAFGSIHFGRRYYRQYRKETGRIN